MVAGLTYLVRISWRDLWRNRRRTVLVGMSMVFSSFIMVFSVGMNSGLVDDMARTVTGSFLGHAQVQSPGFLESPNLEHALSGEQVVALRTRFEELPDVLGYSPRLVTGGLMNKKVPDPLEEDDLSAYRKMTSEGVILIGIEPALERGVSTLSESVVDDNPRLRCLRGCEAALAENYLEPDAGCLEMCPAELATFAGEGCRSACSNLCAGRCPLDDEWCEDKLCQERCESYCEPARFLADVDLHGDELYRGEVVLGTDLAHVLRAGIGDRVALTMGTADGRAHGSIYRVCGLLKTSQPMLNRNLALTHRGSLSAGVSLMGGATSVVLKFDDFERAPEFAATVQAGIRAADSLGRVRVRAWGELAPDVETFIKLKLGGTYVMMLVITLIIAVIVANVVTMSVLERTREYGVRLALGESASRLTASVLIESLLLALFCSAIGTGLGVALVEYYSAVGLSFGMGEIETAGVTLTGVLYPKTTLSAIIFAVGTVLFFALVGTVYPALRIRRIRVMDALHFS
jgi:ABC-type lipoprotein release transport system permease subunit